MKSFTFRHFQTAFLALLFAILIYGFNLLIFTHAPGVFNDPLEDMSFGWYVPLFSIYVIFSERKKIIASFGEPSLLGLIATLPFLALGILGVRGIQVRFEIVAFIGLLLTLTWAVFGLRTAKRILFPAGFLLFCIPLATFLDVITIHLRLLASSVAYFVLYGFGADIIRKGSMIVATDGSFNIDVADPCSGLRSIFALMALTAGYAYFHQPTWFRRGLLFATSIPLAVLGNIVRILSICAVANYASKDFATGFYHDYSGYVVFTVALFCMLLCSEIISRLFASRYSRQKENDIATSESRVATSRVKRIFVLSLLLAIVSYVMIFQATTPEVTLATAPEISLGEIAGFESTEILPSEAELQVLPKDTTIIKRQYKNKNGAWFAVSVIIGGKSKSSIHRPELCLPGQGFQMKSPRTVRVGDTDWRFITLGEKDGSNLGFAYTFFNQDGYKTASHTRRIFRDILDRTLYNRIDRWVMITVNACSDSDIILVDIAQKLKELLK